MSIENLERDIVKWAEDRNLIKGSSPLAQLSKTLEECGEILAALAAREAYKPEKLGHDIDEISDWYRDNTNELRDAYGDTLVTLIIGMEQNGFSLESCLESAYNEIKDRKGKMINGLFCKDAS